MIRKNISEKSYKEIKRKREIMGLDITKEELNRRVRFIQV
jgi:hypothetical protein